VKINNKAPWYREPTGQCPLCGLPFLPEFRNDPPELCNSCKKKLEGPYSRNSKTDEISCTSCQFCEKQKPGAYGSLPSKYLCTKGPDLGYDVTPFVLYPLDNGNQPRWCPLKLSVSVSSENFERFKEQWAAQIAEASETSCMTPVQYPEPISIQIASWFCPNCRKITTNPCWNHKSSQVNQALCPHCSTPLKARLVI